MGASCIQGRLLNKGVLKKQGFLTKKIYILTKKINLKPENYNFSDYLSSSITFHSCVLSVSSMLFGLLDSSSGSLFHNVNCLRNRSYLTENATTALLDSSCYCGSTTTHRKGFPTPQNIITQWNARNLK